MKTESNFMNKKDFDIDKIKKEYNELDLKGAQLIMFNILSKVHKICEKHNIKYWLESGTLLGAVRHKGFIPWDDDVDIGMMREDYEKFLDIAKQELPDNLILRAYKEDENINYNWTKIMDKNSLLVEGHELAEVVEGVYIDIFPYDNYSNNKIKRNLIQNKYKHIFKIALIGEISFNEPFYKPANLLKNFLKLISKGIFKLIKKDRYYYVKKVRKEKESLIIKDKTGIIGYGVDLLYWKNTYPYDWIFPLGKLKFEKEEFYVPNKYNQYLQKLYGDDFMEMPKEEKRVWHNNGIYYRKGVKI